MENENNKGSKAKFFMIVIIALVVAFVILKYSGRDIPHDINSLINSNNNSEINSGIEADKVNLNRLIPEGAVIGTNVLTVEQAVIDFLGVDLKSVSQQFTMETFKQAVTQYEAGEFEKAYFLFEKNTLNRDPVSAILKENCRVISSKEPFIKIAMAVPMTGDSKEMGLKELLGAALSQEEINQVGGIVGNKIVIRLADDMGDKVRAGEVARIIAADTDIIGVVGHYSSGCTLEGAKSYEAAGMVDISPSSSSPLISSAGKYIFRVCPTDIQQGEFLADSAVRKYGKDNNFVLVYNPTEAYSKGLCDSINNSLRKKSIVPKDVLIFNKGAVDFADICDKIKQLDSKVVFYAGEDVEGSNFIVEMMKTNKDTKIFAGDAMFTYKVKEAVGDNSSGLVFSAFYHADAGYKFQEHFTNEFLKRYEGGTPNAVCALAYDAVYTMKKALEYSQKFDRNGMLEGMKSVNFEGATGRIKFDDNGDIANKTMVLLKIENGKFTPVK